MEQKQSFLKRKNIEFSVKRYLIDALSAMAQGLFASLLIGQIIKTLGQQTALLLGTNPVSDFLVNSGTTAMGLSGAAVGAAVAYGLQAPPLVVFASIITGSMGNAAGGPAGAFLAAVIGAEFGKAVSKETKVDIIVTPATTILTGALSALFFGPMISALMNGLGKIIMTATDMQPFLMGIIVSIVVGLALTAPISSAALCIMLELSGDLSREDVSSVRDILSECQHGVTRNELDFYKQYLKNACTLQMKEAEYWMHVVPLRHLEGKDFTTGFSAKIDAVTVDVLERVFMALSEGAGIEYVTIKK
jgi:hypothetical protein